MLIVDKLFKKEGLIVWMSFATIVANIVVVKMINLFGLTSSLGNVLFASNFLVTDILVEKYGAKEAKKAVKMALVFTIIFIATTQLHLLYHITDGPSFFLCRYFRKLFGRSCSVMI